MLRMQIPVLLAAVGLLLACGGGGGSSSPTPPPPAPSSLSYSSPQAVYTVGTAILPNTPTVTGQVSTWSVTPALPAGLALNASTGILSGTPSAPTPGFTTFTVSAANAGGAASTVLRIAVNPIPTGTWTALAPMNVRRSNACAEALPDGRLLIMAGYPGDLQARAEIFDPTTGAWTYTGALPSPRWGGASVRLANGKVLFAGGTDTTQTFATCYLYDPATGAFTATGSLQTARHTHSLVLLTDGKVLAIGGSALDGTPFDTAERYDPATGTWSSAGSFPEARRSAQAIRLTNGKVLLAGGYRPETSPYELAHCALYDPATNQWTPTGVMDRGRHSTALALLPDGKAIIADASDAFGDTSCQTYDPATGLWSGTAAIPGFRRYHQLVTLPSGKVLCAGGTPGDGTAAACYLYDPATATWTPTGDLPGSAAKDFAARVLATGKLLLCGGRIEPGSGGALNMSSEARLYW